MTYVDRCGHPFTFVCEAADSCTGRAMIVLSDLEGHCRVMTLDRFSREYQLVEGTVETCPKS